MALVKDFRGDIYEDLLALIMPRVIAVLDISNVELVEKVFTLLSFGVKYLTKAIKDDIERFYSTYCELLSHKNKFVRRFAAQAFSYVIRKVPINYKLISLIMKPLHEEFSMDKVVGASELLFEVAYGAGESLHSKAKEVMSEMLSFKEGDKGRSKTLSLVIRCLF